MTTKISSVLFTLIILLTVSESSFGKIYKWVDVAGKTHFSSSPPRHGKAETVQPKINTYTSYELPTSDDTKKKPATKPKKVIMYSTIWCGVCRKAKNYFNQNGIAFQEYDIETSAKGKHDYKKLKGSGVPIILIGKQRMNGFSAKRFQSMYGG